LEGFVSGGFGDVGGEEAVDLGGYGVEGLRGEGGGFGG